LDEDVDWPLLRESGGGGEKEADRHDRSLTRFCEMLRRQ
jgi:hypothetical protein